ncbi:hypothetical protein [Mucilaginibacter rubeus]|uniref:DUF4369 domain-containing protein n=1 Tax=Mucilaginibacter rubeus TaxID=2027860 RepID=A0A5C1I7R2_9SPHI|nr:hypothetical protein [Mucilaginibacter rubeus]QEM13894.1 hypothetical protein DEO27_029050 [Mucilaginibacter rubeus]
MKRYKFFCIAALLLLCVQARAQYLSDYTGRPYYLKTNDGIQGSELLTDNWLKGTVDFANGKTANAILNYNVYGDELLFKSPQDSSVQAFVDPVKSFSIKGITLEGSDQTDMNFSNGFPAVDDQTAKTFYQVVGDGKVKLLHYYKKKVQESTGFASQVTTKTFITATSYYLFADNKMTKIKPSQKTILAALSDKADKIQEYVKANKVDFKSDAALAKLFSYYSSL